MQSEKQIIDRIYKQREVIDLLEWSINEWSKEEGNEAKIKNATELISYHEGKINELNWVLTGSM